jgi:hypothetical protein
MVIEESDIIKPDNPTGDAIKSLIRVKPTERAKDSDVELKTELEGNNEVRGHALLSTCSKVLEMSEAEFSGSIIIGQLIDKKERKAWSKNRRSRSEIVEIARQPEIPRDSLVDARKEGFFRKLFTPRNRVNA